jgi:hypothetical protein
MPQHLAALESANRIRFARAALKRRVRDGELTVAEVLTDHREACGRMSIAELLLAQTRWGIKRSSRLLNSVDISSAKRINTLTERQVGVLVKALARSQGGGQPHAAPIAGSGR